jgi:hypothetical protein
MKLPLPILLLGLLGSCISSVFFAGCAQISAPTGGPKDTLAPVLVKANPAERTTSFTGNRISLSFDEYIELKDLQDNLVITPLPKNNPIIISSLKTLLIKFKDTLAPNTTYAFDFGDALRDINEGNVNKHFSFCFSTGDVIDTLKISGKVLMAENGKTDSTLKVYLYRNAPDSAVTSRKPDYMARLNGQGAFEFRYLPADRFSVYVIKDGDGNKFYNSATETFAFLDQKVESSVHPEPVKLFAYVEKKQENSVAPPASKKSEEKKLRYVNNLINGKQDLLQPFELSFSTPVKTFEKEAAILCDTNFRPIEKYEVTVDSTRKKISYTANWKPEERFCLLLSKNALEDSAGLKLSKNDTIRFAVKAVQEYGSLKLSFKNLDLSKNPLLQFMDGDQVRWKFPVSGIEWMNKMMLPGDYEVRLLYDENSNGVWDPGNYSKKRQPEIAITLPQKISVKADWENERDIEL